MRIAVVQFHINHENKEDNFTRVEKFVQEASQKNADLVVFPEYVFGGPDESMIETVPGEAVQRLQKLAKKYKVDLVPGTLMERDPADDNVYNTAYYIDQSGEILLSYRKVHLWHSERTYITKGEGDFRVVKNRFGINVGMCICWDMAFPEVFRELSLKNNAQLIIIPVYWTLLAGRRLALAGDILSEAKFLDAMSVLRCYENSVVLAVANPANEGDVDRKQPFGTMAGHSQIAAPFKGTIVHSDHLKEEMIITDVDIQTITDEAEKLYKVRQDYKNGLIHGSATNCGGSSKL